MNKTDDEDRKKRPLPKKKLYHVRFVLDTVVAAKDAEEAKAVALRERDDILDQDYAVIPPDVTVVGRVAAKEDLPRGWNNNCIPWGVEMVNGTELVIIDYL